MSTDNAKAALTQAKALIDQALNELTSTPTTPGTTGGQIITTVAEFDQAYANAPSGSQLLLASSLRYDKPLTLAKPITLRAATVFPNPGQRMDRATMLPLFTNGIRAYGPNIKLQEIDIRHTNPLTDVAVLTGFGSQMVRCRVLGDEKKGAKRGIAANAGSLVIMKCYVDDIFQPAQDTQAISSWNMPGQLMIDDCYLAAAGQSVMFGGADSSDRDMMPNSITLANSTLTKNPNWLTGQQCKCALEFKAAYNVYVHNCVLEYGGTSMGQGNYLIVATPRNQDGRADWSSVGKILIEYCVGGKAAGIINMLGSDNTAPSGKLDGLTLQNCTFENIDPAVYPGAGRLFMFDRAPQNITIRNVTVRGQNIKSFGYFTGEAPKGLTLDKLSLPPTSTYGWKVDGSTGMGGSGKAALQAYMPDAILNI